MNSNEPWIHAHEVDYTQYILWFFYACVIYSLIGFSWGVIVGMLPELREFINHRPHGNLIMLGHGHINLLGWVEMAIFGSVYYIIPRIVKRPIYSLRLVKVHFWTHNFGLLGMVISFVAAGTLGGMASMSMIPDEVKSVVRPFMIMVGLFGSLVLAANCIWAYNIFRTCTGWKERQ